MAEKMKSEQKQEFQNITMQQQKNRRAQMEESHYEILRIDSYLEMADL